MSTPSWVSSYKTPAEDQWVADPRTGAPTGVVPSSVNTGPVTSETHFTSATPDFSSRSYKNELVNRLSYAPIESIGHEQQAHPNKYESIHNLQRAQKVDALKDMKLNPFELRDPYDTLSHNFYLWTQVGNKALSNVHITQAQQEQIASNFYDRMIAPAYGGLKITPMDKKLWMQQAYKEALNYNIEDAYNNSLIHNLKEGMNSGLAATARAYGRITDMLGNEVDDAIALWRSGKFGKVLGDIVADRPAWFQTISAINSQVQAQRAKQEPGLVKRGAIVQSAKRQFWADALPTQDGFWNHATSMVAEGIGQAPIFAAMSLAQGGGVPGLSLGEMLKASPLGARLSGYLLAGAEGLAYGAAAHKQDDAGEAWRDAVGFFVFHGLFDVGGMGLKKLTDIAPSAWKDKLARYSEKLDMAQNGQRPATPVEQYEMHQKEVANNIVATGQLGQRAIFVDALHHIKEMESAGLDRKAIREAEAALLKQDPERWSPVLSSAKFIRTLLGDKRLSDLKPGSEEEKFLSERLEQLIVDAGEKINTEAIGQDASHLEKAAKTLKASGAKHTLQYYQEQAAQQLKASGATGLVTPEQVQKYAEKLYAEDLAKAAEEAQKQVVEKPVEKATNAARRRKDKPVPGMKIRSERTINKYGEPAARYQIVPDYKVRLKAHIAAAKAAGKSMAKYFEDLDDQDFVNDLSTYFYPKELRQAKVFFEHQNTREGMQNPNFLAFMYNYLPQMPREFGKELENRLIDTVKVQKYMRGKEPTEPQLLYYAKAMYNHVDNFLSSGRWPEESNLFRSSNANMFKTTEWQRQLLIEKQLQEQANLKDMFSGDKKALRAALTTHKAFSELRLNEFDKASLKRGSQDIIHAYDELIADLQTESEAAKKAGYKRWRF